MYETMLMPMFLPRQSISFLLLCLSVASGGLTAARGQGIPPYRQVRTQELYRIIVEINAEDILAQVETTNDIPRAMDQAALKTRIGDWPQAIRIYEALAKMDPDNPRIQLQLATAYTEVRQYEKALSIFSRLIRREPDSYVLLNNLAWLYATADDHKIRDGRRAIQYAQEALLRAPEQPNIWNTLSEAYFIMGRYEQAMRAAEHAFYLARMQGADAATIARFNRQHRKCLEAHQSEMLIPRENDE